MAEIVKREHPQIVATILAHLPSQQAADVLKELDGAMQADIAMRMARLDEVPETALQELDAHRRAANEGSDVRQDRAARRRESRGRHDQSARAARSRR